MRAPTVLVVEDEEDVRRVELMALHAANFKVLAARTGEAGLAKAAEARPDLVVLDISLPGIDGYEFIRRLRGRSRVPVVCVTGKSELVDRLLALKMGADDYLVKPFFPEELVARVEAVLRRARGRAGRDAQDTSLRAGDLELDVERHVVRVDGHTRALTPKEFDLLKVLMEQDGRVLSREKLLERVWGYEDGLELDTRTVDQHVARIRHKLGKAAGRVVTVERLGYRIAPD